MRKTFTAIMGFLYGFGAFLGIGVFALLIYDWLDGLLGITFTVAILALALYMWYVIFISFKRRGMSEFMGVRYSTPDLSNLEPTPNSGVQKLSANQFADNFRKGEHICKGGYVRIWGDWQERGLEDRSMIKEVDYVNNELSIMFLNGNRVTVLNPRVILIAETYIKILHADEIKWEWKWKNRVNYMKYELKDNNIKVTTNSDWQSHKMDVLFGETPLVILN